MSSLAEELLQDFEDSGSDDHDEGQNGTMEIDGDEEGFGDEDEKMGNGDDANGATIEADDEEEAKAKVEKMDLGHVDDVRSVAGLMKTLEPVLQVSTSLLRSAYKA